MADKAERTPDKMRPKWTVRLCLELGVYVGGWDEKLLLTREQKDEIERDAVLYEGFDLEEAQRVFAAFESNNKGAR